MSEEKHYSIKHAGIPNILINAQDPNDVVALCGCGKTKNPEHYCDGSHLSNENAESDDEEMFSGCCGGGCCSGK